MLRKLVHSSVCRFSTFPLDINLFRQQKGIQSLKQSAKRRFKDPSMIDRIVMLDRKYRENLYSFEQNRKAINNKNKELKDIILKKQEQEKGNILKQIDLLKQESTYFTSTVTQLESELKQLVSRMGNIVDEEVKVGNDENENQVYETWGEKKQGRLPYWEILEKRLDAVDMKRGTKVTGHRGYFLKGVGVRLAQALTSYGMNFLENEGYTLYQTPVTIKEDLMKACCQLSSIEEDVYKLKDENLMLIATSQQSLASLYSGQVLESTTLPLRLGGYSLCFRKEAGAAGKDNQGIFRVHQFQKLEQFVICSQQQSRQFQFKMLDVSKRFYRSLQIPYQVVEIVSGALNDAATRKFDLQGWFPHANKYRELVSVSNCTDYQSRMLDVKYRDKGTTKYVHMLNGTLCAIERTMCALVENYYTEEGIKLPGVLANHYGSEIIQFVN